MGTLLLVAASAFDIALAAFHLNFPSVFRWRKALFGLDAVNRGIIQVMNLSLAFLFVLAGVHAALLAIGILPIDPGARTLLVGAGLFWSLRAVLQVVFFGIVHRISLLFVVLFGLGAAVHFAAAAAN
jgi:hypothetical protein